MLAMSTKIRNKVQAAAWDALSEIEVRPEKEMTVKAQDEMSILSLTIRPLGADAEAEAMPTSSNPLFQFFFSPLSRSVVKEVATHGCLKAGAIAKKLGSSGSSGNASSTLYSALSDLCQRGILEVTDEGYKLSEDFAPLSETLLSD